MTFIDYTYIRPDYGAIKEKLTRLTEQLASAKQASQALSIIKQITAIHFEIDTQQNLWSIRHSINLNDSFYNEETNFWNEYEPLFNELKTYYYQTVLSSPFRKELENFLPQTFFLLAENQLKTFQPQAISLFQQENKLVDRYNTLMGTARLDFRGNTYNLSQMIPFGESTDRETRKEAMETVTAYFEKHESEFDDIYDQLVKIRHEIAQVHGFTDYVEYGYAMMNRFDYTRDMVQDYRQEILQHVVPLVYQLRQRQAKRIQVPHLAYYDLNVEFLSGNAKPQGNPDELLAQAHTMYRELSPETGEFFDYMVANDLLDLVAKDGKDTGGYCTYIPNYNSPFIFANFNGTSGDIDVLTHEAGHAFQVYHSRWIPTLECIWPTYESCEIHSMSMEFITWPWMERFFNHQADKYRFSHLSSTLFFLPYGALVDHFQHEIYERPDITPNERKATWANLQSQYLPDRDFSDSDFLSRGGFWFRQGHIFASPFYYIDYTLAQICALQFWKRTQIDQDKTAWEDYLRICQIGGTKTFLQIVKEAGLQSPFEKGTLKTTIAAVSDYLSAVDDTQL